VGDPVAATLTPSDVLGLVRDIPDLHGAGVFHLGGLAEGPLDRPTEPLAVRLDEGEAVLPVFGHMDDDRRAHQHQHRPCPGRSGPPLGHPMPLPARVAFEPTLSTSSHRPAPGCPRQLWFTVNDSRGGPSPLRPEGRRAARPPRGSYRAGAAGITAWHF